MIETKGTKSQTYHRGDLFQNIGNHKHIYMLAQVDDTRCALVNFYDGNRWQDPIEFKNKGFGYEIPDDSPLWGSNYGRERWILLDKSFVELRYLGERVGKRLFSENEKKMEKKDWKRTRMIRLI
jgi:hypothetical protein